jgi:hypothetical protein
LSRTVAVKL